MVDVNKDFASYFNRLYDEKVTRMPQKKVAELLGIAQSTLSKLKAGGMIPSDKLAQRISEVWEVNLQDLMDVIYKARRESGAKFLREARQREENEQAEVKTKPRLPVTAAAGSLSQYSKGVLLEQCEQMPIIRNFPDYDYTMFIKGNSMEPKYESGDEIAIKKAEFVIEWGKDYVLDTQDGVIFKKIYEDGENIRCVSYNHDEYPDFLVPKEIIYGYYKFVGLVRV